MVHVLGPQSPVIDEVLDDNNEGQTVIKNTTLYNIHLFPVLSDQTSIM